MGSRSEHASSAVAYHYERPADLPLRVAHGVWGGVNPHGEIEMNFYDESDVPPRHVIQHIAPDGSPGPETCPGGDENLHIARQIHSRILMNYNTARAVLEWLEDRLSDLENENSGALFSINSSGIEQ